LRRGNLLLPLRIVLIALLIRFAEFSLSMPRHLSVIIHGTEALLLVFAAVYALFYGISILGCFFVSMPDQFKEAFPFKIIEQVKRVLKLIIVIL
jgi:hypothetical protein